MLSNVADYSTDDLLRMIDSGEDFGEDFAYTALRTVVARFV